MNFRYPDFEAKEPQQTAGRCGLSGNGTARCAAGIRRSRPAEVLPQNLAIPFHTLSYHMVTAHPVLPPRGYPIDPL